MFLLVLILTVAFGHAKSNASKEINVCPSRTVIASRGSVISPNFPSKYPNNQICTLKVVAGNGYNMLDYIKSSRFSLETHSYCRYDYLQVFGIRKCGRSGPNYARRRVSEVSFTFRSDGSLTGLGFKLEFQFSKVKDACVSNPCENNSTCRSYGDSYFCNCRSHLLTGQRCETKLEDPCDVNPCANGRCIPQLDYYTHNLTFQCACRRGWTGRNCDTKLPPRTCESNPCQNNGSCSDWKMYRSRNWTYQCYCQRNFTGQNCENRLVDPCDESPCVNGTCRSYRDYYTGNLRYTCSCERGFTGRHCNTRLVDPCDDSPCVNGTCRSYREYYSGNITYTCRCQRGFTGRNCDTRLVDPCDESPCVNGTCRSYRDYYTGNLRYTCSCERGFTGRHCNTRLPPRPCDVNPCRNNGSCSDWKMYRSGNWTYQCYCRSDFTGQNCENNLGPSAGGISVCPSRTVYASSGVIVSPNFPRNYPNNMNCKLKIIPEGTFGRVRVYSTKFDLEDSSSCKYDYLQLFRNGKQCGRSRISTTLYNVNSLDVAFRSDASATRGGFSLKFRFMSISGDEEAQDKLNQDAQINATNDEEDNVIEKDKMLDFEKEEDLKDEENEVDINDRE